jgi:hypothetical protein
MKNKDVFHFLSDRLCLISNFYVLTQKKYPDLLRVLIKTRGNGKLHSSYEGKTRE